MHASGMLYLLLIFYHYLNIQKFHFMKKFRLLLASASLLVLLFCGTEASAQSGDYSGVAQLDVKQLVQVGNLDLVEKTQALEILSELKTDLGSIEDDMVVTSIKYGFIGVLNEKLSVSNEPVSSVVENSIIDLVRIGNRFKNVTSSTLSSVYNEVVSELEN